MSDTTSTNSGSMTEQTADKASAVADTAKQQASGVVSATKDEVASVTQDAKEHARDLVQQSREQLRTQASEQSQRVAGSLRELGQQLQGMAAGEAPAPGLVADVTNQAGSSVSRLAERLDRGGFETVVNDVKRFARRRPGVFVLGAVGAGFLAGRLLRSTDTGAIVDAAKSSMGGGDQSGGDGGASGHGGNLETTTATPPPPAGTVPHPGLTAPTQSLPIATDPTTVVP